jgi:hypothetical protein
VGRVRALVRQYPTTTFFLLTFLITWAVWVPRVVAPDSFAGTLALFGTYKPAVSWLRSPHTVPAGTQGNAKGVP